MHSVNTQIYIQQVSDGPARRAASRASCSTTLSVVNCCPDSSALNLRSTIVNSVRSTTVQFIVMIVLAEKSGQSLRQSSGGRSTLNFGGTRVSSQYRVSRRKHACQKLAHLCRCFDTILGYWLVPDINGATANTIRYDTIRDAILTCARKPT